MSTKTNYKFKGVWIPKQIWLSKDLTWMEKCILAEIEALSDENDPCTASRTYLAKMFDVGLKRVSNIVSELKGRGFLIGSFEDGLRTSDKFPKLGNSVPESREEEFPKVGQPNKGENLGENKGGSGVAGKSKSEHQSLIDKWVELYPFDHDGRDYSFALNAGKDAAAIKRLLAATKKTAAEIMFVVEVAWKNQHLFNCKQSDSIAGFASRWNEINGELSRLNLLKKDDAPRPSGPQNF